MAHKVLIAYDGTESARRAMERAAELWSADDTFASALMDRFYQRLGQGEDTASALRSAKLDLLAKYGEQVSPFYWAAFIAVGEASTPVGIKQ